MKKYISCLLVLLALVLPMLGMEAAAAETSGTCGENVTWTLDDAGTLTISGTGDMENYDSGTAPWYGQRTKIQSVVIEDGVTGIGEYAFYGCVKMTDITIADSVTWCGFYAFEKCSSLTSVYITDVAVWLNLDNQSSLLTGNELEKKLYLDGKLITQLVIPEGVTEIVWYAFYNCSSLKSVTIPDSVTYIDDSAFLGCTSLKSVTIPDSVTYIDDSAFSGCTSLKSVTIPDSVTYIGEDAFSSCSSLESVTIPDSVTYIRDDTFEYCSSLKHVTIPEGVTEIGASAFYNCSNLKSVTIGDGVTEIDRYAFSGCSSLESVIIPEGVTEIGDGAFYNCSSLESVTIGNGVVEIGVLAFCNCSSLESVTIPDSVTEIGPYAFANSSLESVTIPDSVTYIDYEAFYECNNLATVHYGGTEVRRAGITIDSGNWDLEEANWHYECDGASCPNPFADVAEDAYYAEPVRWAVNNGITNGLSENSFGPEATCTRGQIVTFLWRANGSPEPKNSSNPFWDVTDGDYFYKAVLWAVENGITSGMGDGSFAPGAPCTRGQVATFLWRACGQPAPSGTNIFTDIAPGAYYYDAVLWAVENGITNGMGDGSFAPDAPCTRGQIVTFLYRAMA